MDSIRSNTQQSEKNPLPSLSALFRGEMPEGYLSVQQAMPTKSGIYQTIDAVGLMEPVVQYGYHWFRAESPRWMENKGLKIIAWRPKEV